MRIHKQGHCRAERQRAIRNQPGWTWYERCCGRRGQLVMRGVEYMAEAVQLVRDIDDGHDDDDVDKNVFDERNERRRPETAGIGVCREDRKGDKQRQVLSERAAATADTDDLKHRL